jgi:hypothetical protein
MQLIRLLGPGQSVIGGLEGGPGLAEVAVPGQSPRPDRVQPGRSAAGRQKAQAVLRVLGGVGVPVIPDRRQGLRAPRPPGQRGMLDRPVNGLAGRGVR